MNARNLLSAMAFTVTVACSYAQDCMMPLSVQLDDEFANVPEAAKSVLYQSLQRIATNSGMSTDLAAAPFVLTAHCDVLDKSNLAGPPIQTVYNLGVTLYIADTYTRKKFATAYLTLDGVGTGEVKAYTNAFRRINANNEEVKKLISSGRTKMLAYYDSQYETIIKEAQRMESLQNYEEALVILSSIPVCSKGYDKASKYTMSLYGKYLNRLNLYVLNQARAIWNAAQNPKAASEACALLAQIDPESECYAEATGLMKEIKTQIRSDIDFEMREKYHDSVRLEETRIGAIKAVGVAYGNGQKEKTTNLMWLK